MRAFKFITVFVMLLCFLITGRCFGQEIHYRSGIIDTSQRITLNSFKYRVDRAIKLLETKKLSAISDTDHVNIMMCINTFEFSNVKNNKSIKPRYNTLISLLVSTQHLVNIKKIYPTYTWNHGMGLYFPKLKMELLGMPSAYAQFEVEEK